MLQCTTLASFIIITQVHVQINLLHSLLYCTILEEETICADCPGGWVDISLPSDKILKTT